MHIVIRNRKADSPFDVKVAGPFIDGDEARAYVHSVRGEDAPPMQPGEFLVIEVTEGKNYSAGWCDKPHPIGAGSIRVVPRTTDHEPDYPDYS